MNPTMNHTNTQRGWYRGVFRDERGGGAKVAAAPHPPNQFFRGSPNTTIKKTIKREKKGL